jgi:Holliday junction resolvase
MAKKNQYSYGIKKEQKVAQSLRNRGAKVNVSVGSKGSADLVAKFSTGTTWNVQVKSSRSSSPSSLGSKEVGRLKQSSTKTGATAVVAKVSSKGIEYSSAKSGRKLNPPKSKK